MWKWSVRLANLLKQERVEENGKSHCLHYLQFDEDAYRKKREQELRDQLKSERKERAGAGVQHDGTKFVVADDEEDIDKMTLRLCFWDRETRSYEWEKTLP
ncbi:unnamed protein product, partial [Amoebophrya sp. A120]